MANERSRRRAALARLPIDGEARRLARASQAETASIRASYIFPNGRVIRIVHVDADVFPRGRVLPFAFTPDPAAGVHYASQIALIHPSEEGRVPPPPGWGSWDRAERIERRHKKSA
jgi:hypothetical protein